MLIIIIIVFIALFISLGFGLWFEGLKKQDIAMTIIGGFLALNFLGLIVAVVQSSKFPTKK